MGIKKGNQSNILKNFSVTIDGTKLTNGQINELYIKWNVEDFKITGSMSFTDLTGLVEELPIRGGNTVVMAMTDFDDVVSKQKFKVTSVSTTRTVQHPSVTLTLLDPITLAAIQMYNEMSWHSATMLDIIDHPETLKPLLTGKKKDFCPPPPPHKNFVMPLHVSFNVVMHWLAKNADVMFYQNRDSFVIQPLKKLFKRGKKGDKFILKTTNQQYRRNIYEYNLNMGKELLSSALQPTGKVASFNPSNKHSKHTKESFSSARSKLGETASFGLTPDKQANTGAKYFYKSDYHVEKTSSHQWMKHAYQDVQLEILVPGQFGTNIGDIVKVEMDNWRLQSTPEKNMTGLWFITEIIDVITPPEFVQRIVLSRSKYFK